MRLLVLTCLTCLLTVSFSQQLEERSGLRFLALGDSYTIGQSVNPAERWPNLLRDSLEANYELTFDEVRFIAQTGWRTDNLQSAIEIGQPDSAYDLVGLLIGVNNFYQGRPESQYILQFEELLVHAIALAQGDNDKVMVVSIPDYAYTPFGAGASSITAGIMRYNAINDSITALYQVDRYFITDISREGLNDPSLVASDGLHPSGSQYAEWVRRIWPQVEVNPVLSVATKAPEEENFLWTDSLIKSNRGAVLVLSNAQGRMITAGVREIRTDLLAPGVYLVQDTLGNRRKIVLLDQ